MLQTIKVEQSDQAAQTEAKQLVDAAVQTEAEPSNFSQMVIKGAVTSTPMRMPAEPTTTTFNLRDSVEARKIRKVPKYLDETVDEFVSLCSSDEENEVTSTQPKRACKREFDYTLGH